MQKKSMSIKGKETFFLDSGISDAPVILFLHGFPESSLLWVEAISAVEKLGYRAIAPDLPGFGQSHPFDEASTWERYMEFITDFTNELSLDQFHLVTHDWGALIGTRWACTHHESVKSLIISDATFSSEFVWHKDAQIVRKEGTGEQWVSYLRNKPVFEGFMKKSVPNVSEAIIEDFYRLFSDSLKDRVTLELYRSGDMDKLEIYRGRLVDYLSMPITIIFGEYDHYIHPDMGLKLKNDELHHASFHIIPGVGHFTPLEASTQFISILTQHLLNNSRLKI